VSTARDGLTNRYLNAFTDPYNHFVYGATCAPRTFGAAYPLVASGVGWRVYDVAAGLRAGRPPLIALAQGVAVRLPFVRDPDQVEDDVEPIFDAIDRGGLVAVVPAARIQHHTVRDVHDFLGKFGPRITVRLEDRGQPVWHRARRLSRARMLRTYAFPFYAVSLIGPLLWSVAGFARDREPLWFYHPVVTTVLGVEFWRRAFDVFRRRFGRPARASEKL
jgi:hypothetical protein